MPYTKKQLEERFNVAKSTLHERLKDCGLDTKKKEYTDEEIETRFRVADNMMREGRSREEVRRHFGVSDAEETQRSPTSSPPQGNSNIVMDTIAHTVKELFAAEVREGIRHMLPLLPSIVEREFIAVIQSGEFHQSFIDYEEQVQKPRRRDYYDITHYTVGSVGGLSAARHEEDDNEEETEEVQHHEEDSGAS